MDSTSSRDHLPPLQTPQLLGQSTRWAELPGFQFWASVSTSPQRTWDANITVQGMRTRGEQRLQSQHTAGLLSRLPKGMSVRNITGEWEENPPQSSYGLGRAISGLGELIPHLSYLAPPNLSSISIITTFHWSDLRGPEVLCLSFLMSKMRGLYEFTGWISLGCCVN